MTDAHLWHNGRIFTGRRFAEALLVEGGRVGSVGTIEEVRRAAPSGTEIHDLAGQLVLPGLIDAHLHLLEIARARESLDVRGMASFAVLAERIGDWARSHPDGAIVGGGWEVEQFREGRPPDREVLDRGSSERPIVLYHTSGHCAAVNGVALSRCGIERSTPDPPNGRIGRAADGSPNGLLYEEAMRPVHAVAAAAFPPDRAALRRALQEAAAFGLTTVATMNASREETMALRTLATDGDPPARIRVYVRVSRLEEFAPSDLVPSGGDGMFVVTGAKGFTDGAFGPRTAWLSEPYTDASGESGIPIGSEAELSSQVQSAVDRGLAPALHAIGDRAIARALRIVLSSRPGRANAPARIEHAALTPPALFDLLDRTRPALVIQPGFVWSDVWLAERLGSTRARWTYRFRTLLERGLLLAGSSDAPFDPLDPWRGLQALGSRTDSLGRSANPAPEEALSAEEAIGLYSVNGGRVLGERDLGTLEPGARADLVIAKATDPAHAIREGSAVVQETWVQGRRVYERTTRGRG